MQITYMRILRLALLCALVAGLALTLAVGSHPAHVSAALAAGPYSSPSALPPSILTIDGSSSSMPLGWIVGGSIGGVLAIAGGAYGLLHWRRG